MLDALGDGPAHYKDTALMYCEMRMKVASMCLVHEAIWYPPLLHFFLAKGGDPYLNLPRSKWPEWLQRDADLSKSSKKKLSHLQLDLLAFSFAADAFGWS